MKLTDGERLILLMLCDVYEQLGIRQDIDARFVKAAILNGQTWGIPMRISGVPWESKETPPAVRDVMSLLDLWSSVEGSFAALSQDDKKRVATEVASVGGGPTFQGFDGNTEIEHLSVTRFLIEHLDRFSRFMGRDLNSHRPMLPAYRRMYATFERIRSSAIGNLTADQLIEVLK